MNEPTKLKITELQQQVDKFQEEITEKICTICNELGYKKGSVFSYNIDRLKQFTERLNEF